MTGIARTLLLTLLAALMLAAPAMADEAGPALDTEDEVRFVSVGWTGVTIKTEIGVAIMNCLGYESSNTMVSVPIAYEAMAMDEADVFLGNWMPSMASIANPFFEEGTVENYVANMPGAKYTLAVPTYVAEGGLTHFKDIAKYADKLDNKIYGIEEGNDGNLIIQEMIDKDMFDLADFELVPSSEAGMLSQVQSYARNEKWIVFLGWAPHSMNERIDMTYLKGSTSETFGGNDGTATVYTNVRDGFLDDNPNLAKFFKQFTFPIPMMNQIMTTLHEDSSLKPRQAALRWLEKNPDQYAEWLDGVTTKDGKPALPVFKDCLPTLKK
ncbi:ABC transporter substrate-binding protein [Desulfohalovibrio reitneri]|uniref:ABC transporter substrate-binding protein n=1 Tax=Desulfohalovibrio reitneri TaxID=1307759 RepID=UPI0004A6CCB3|nr:ABC transporter substrate-binding protein [Desulfohalovibrio reitneri]